MSNWTIRYNTFTAEEFRSLWESVWNHPPTLEQIRLALDHTLFRVGIYDGSSIVAMARMIGDVGMCCYIKDVIVHPDYQGQGIGSILMQELLRYIEENGIKNTEISAELSALPEKIPFYEKFGFFSNRAQRLRKMVQITVKSGEKDDKSTDFENCEKTVCN